MHIHTHTHTCAETKTNKLARVRRTLFLNLWPEWQPFEILSYMELFLFIFVNVRVLYHFVI